MNRLAPRPDPSSPVRLALPQETFWTVHRLMARHGGIALNVRCDLRLGKNVATEVVQRALEALAARHESLRTVFRDVEGRGFQVVTGDVPSLEVVDVTDDDDPPAASDRVAAAEMETKFRLGDAPPWRAVLVRLGPAEARLLVTLHHMVADGWSLRVVEREIAELVAAAEESRAPDLPDLPVQYADFAAWQDQTVRRGELQRQLRHWMQVLDHPPLGLAVDAERGTSLAGGGRTTTVTVDAPTTAALTTSCRKARATEFTGLLAALRIALHGWSGQDDIVMSSATAGRGHPETVGVVGCFFNTVALRSRRPAGSHLEAVREIRNALFDALRHQDVPIDSLLRALWVEEARRGNSRQPVIEAGLQHEDPVGPFPVDWIVQSPPAAPELEGRPGLSVYTIRRGAAIEASITIPERFHRAAADDLVKRFLEAVAAIAHRPDDEVARARPRPAGDRLEVRGLRVDAAALGRALVAHPSIEDAHAGVRARGRPGLVAWVVLTPGTNAVEPPEVRRHLEEHGQWFGLLPALCSVREIPRRDGRVVREHLPEPPDPPRPTPAPPSSPEELRLAAVFERVVGVAPSDVNDHVFLLGGDDVSARRVVELAEAAGFVLTGWKLPEVSIADLLRRARRSAATP